MKLPGTAQISANSARCPQCAGQLAFKSCQRSRWHRANSDIGLQQSDFIGGQIEQRIDFGVDLGFQPRDFGCQGVDFGAAGGDPVFPIVAFLKRDSGLQHLLHFLLESGKVGQGPPFLQLGRKLGIGRIGCKVWNAAGDRLLQFIALFRPCLGSRGKIANFGLYGIGRRGGLAAFQRIEHVVRESRHGRLEQCLTG